MVLLLILFKVEAPIKISQVVAKNLFGKKIDLMSTREIDIINIKN